jgi:hypothetical protein
VSDEELAYVGSGWIRDCSDEACFGCI